MQLCPSEILVWSNSFQLKIGIFSYFAHEFVPNEMLYAAYSQFTEFLLEILLGLLVNTSANYLLDHRMTVYPVKE
jgi:hypothetical protein